MAAQYQASITVDAVITALIAFLNPFVTPAQIIRGQQNRVAPPVGPFVEVTELRQVDLSTPIIVGNKELAQADVTGPKRIDIQIDFYGPTAGDQCTAVKGIYRSYLATAAFPDGITPLYCTDGTQAPLLDAEEQYESRWTLTASLQYNSTVSIPLQFANKLAINLMEDVF